MLLQDPGFNAEPLTPRPAAAIDWGSAAPPSKPAPVAAAIGTSSAPLPPLPRSSATASGYADLSDRYLDRPQPAAATPQTLSDASFPKPAPQQPQPAHQSRSDSAEGAAAAVQGRSADAAAAGNIAGRSAASLQAPTTLRATGGGLLPAPDATAHPPLWSDASSVSGDRQRQQLGGAHADGSHRAADPLPNGLNGGGPSRTRSDATNADEALADVAGRQPAEGEVTSSDTNVLVVCSAPDTI